MKNKWLFSAIAAIMIILAAVFVILQQASKPDKVIAKFENAVEKKDTKQLEQIIIADNKNAFMNKPSMNALMTYLKTNQSSFDVIKEGLNTQIKNKDYGQTNQQISLVRDGEKWAFFPNYKLKVKTVELKVLGQNEEDEIHLSFNGMNLPEKKGQKIYGPLLPGTYQTSVTVKNDLGTFIKEMKKDAWGNSEVSLIVDDNQLAQKDEKIQNDMISAIDLFNHDLTVYETSGLKTEKLTNITDDFKNAFSLKSEQFKMVKDYVDVLQAQYLGSVVNLDELSIQNFDSQWKAEIEALVSYNEKVKYRGERAFKDLSHKSIRKYSLKYNADKKKWMIDGADDMGADGSESSTWKNKKEIKQKDSPVLKWNREKGQGNII